MGPYMGLRYAGDSHGTETGKSKGHWGDILVYAGKCKLKLNYLDMSPKQAASHQARLLGLWGLG